MSLVARVLLTLPLPEAFDYEADPAKGLAVGDQVAVPLGPRLVRGVVVELKDVPGQNRPLKPVASRLDDPPLPANTLAFVDWASRYALQPPGDALVMALRGLRAPPPRPEILTVATGQAPTTPTAARLKVLEAAAASGPLKASALAAAAGVGAAVVKGLIADGALALVERAAPAAFEPPDPSRPGPELNPDQAAASR